TDAWFLLRGNDAATAHLEPRDDEISQLLSDLREKLQKIEAEHPAQDEIDPDGELLRKRLGELDWGEPLINDVVGIIADSKLFSVELASLPTAVAKLLDRQIGDDLSVPLDSSSWVPDKVEELVAYDSDNNRLRALRTLSRSDRKRLLLASATLSAGR